MNLKYDHYGMGTRTAVIAVVIVAVVVVGVAFFYVGMGEVGEKEPIKIGALYDLTGALSAYGTSHKKATQAAVDFVNSEYGGINGRPVELIVEDTETKTEVGVSKYRRLAVKNNVDFVLGSDSSGIVVATNPLAKELNTVTFQMGSSNKVVTSGNRYTFHSLGISDSWGKSVAKFAMQETDAEKWSIICWDYAWGHSGRDDFKKYLSDIGGSVVSIVNVPLGETDMTRYVPKLSEETEGVYLVMFGAGEINSIKQVNQRFGDIPIVTLASFVGIKLETVGDFINGSICDEAFMPPHYKDDPEKWHDIRQRYRKLLEVDNYGRDAETGEPRHYPNAIMGWDAVFYIKEAVEETGWKSREDNPELIKYLEGHRIEDASIEHPQAPEYIRPEDHVIWKPHLFFRVVDFRRRLIARLNPSETFTEPLVDYTKEEFK